MRNTGILTKLAYVKVWLGNSVGLASDIKYPILLGTFLKVWFPSMTWATLGIVTVVALILMVFVGFVDMKIVRFTPLVKEIDHRHNNFFFAKLEKAVNGKLK